MTLGEKIAKQRKENNYTQEQLAQILGVSRQSVSKWESDIAYPETEKLIRLGDLFGCSMDYLLKDAITDKDTKHTQETVVLLKKLPSMFLKERRSEKTICGVPLYHIGRDARGIFAVGLRARGLVSVGLFSCGILSVGLLSVGLIGFGVLALGLLSVGSIALGLLAAGAISIGIVSFGALSVGCFSGGALAVGRYVAVGDHASAMIAVGETKAVGSVFGFDGGCSVWDVEVIKDWLDHGDHIPVWLGWAKELFKFCLGKL